MIPCLPAPTKAAALVSGRSFVIRTFSNVARTVGRMASDTSSDTNGKCRMPKRNRKYTRKAHTVMAPKRLARVIVKRWSQPPSLWTGTGRLAISNPNSNHVPSHFPPPFLLLPLAPGLSYACGHSFHTHSAEPFTHPTRVRPTTFPTRARA